MVTNVPTCVSVINNFKPDNMTIKILCLFLALWTYPLMAQNLTPEEQELYLLIDQYRKEKGLPSIPLSVSLTHVAQLHVKDLNENYISSNKCNAHSWSSKGNWTSCCYTSDHAQAKCMWKKPSELTKYKGYGYEIAYWNSNKARPFESLEGWKNSPGHNEVIINQGPWESEWNAIGIGLSGNYSVVWFGMEVDDN